MNLISTINHTLDLEMAVTERCGLEDVGVEGGVSGLQPAAAEIWGQRCFDTPSLNLPSSVQLWGWPQRPQTSS